MVKPNKEDKKKFKNYSSQGYNSIILRFPFLIKKERNVGLENLGRIEKNPKSYSFE